MNATELLEMLSWLEKHQPGYAESEAPSGLLSTDLEIGLDVAEGLNLNGIDYENWRNSLNL